MEHCIRHFEEPLVAHCRTCGKPYCSRCLVYAFGPKKPPYCVGCALAASGVRNANKPVVTVAPATPASDRRLERAQKRAEKAAERAEQKAARRAAKKGEVIEEEEPRTSNVPVPKGLATPAARYASTSTNPNEGGDA